MTEIRLLGYCIQDYPVGTLLNVNGYELSDQRRVPQRRFVIHVSMSGTDSSYEFVLTLCYHSWTPRPSTITHGMGGIKAIKKS
jgi:hypothetical protein